MISFMISVVPPKMDPHATASPGAADGYSCT
jgi:hypothetical protein